MLFNREPYVNLLIDTIKSTPIATATWVDWVDITVLSLLVYQLLLALRGTRGQQVGGGLILVGGVYAVSKLAGLSTLAWVFDGLLVYVALAVVILFQEDIRVASWWLCVPVERASLGSEYSRTSDSGCL